MAECRMRYLIFFTGALVFIGFFCTLSSAATLTDILGPLKVGIASEWSSWTECDRICSNGYKFRTQDCTPVDTSETNPGNKSCNWNATEVMSCYNCSGNWKTWTEWDACALNEGSCGFGRQKRNRTCVVSGFGVVDIKNCTGSDKQNRSCEIACSVFANWSQPTPCNETCGTGFQSKEKTCSLKYKNGTDTGVSCLKQVDVTPCTLYTGCQVAVWQTWKPCSNSCGNGTRTRKMICEYGAKYEPGKCDYNATEVETCTGYNCPGANWTAWSTWSDCNTTCDLGYRRRDRNCTFLSMVVDTVTCGNDSVEYMPCNVNNSCPVPTWTNFTDWSSCNASCGGGIQTRNRTCMHLAYGNCSGNATEVQECNTMECAVPIIGEWTEWIGCTESCEGTVQRRERNCTLEGILVNSTKCNGTSFEERNCSDTELCKKPSWTTWSEWSGCSEYCGTGLKTRERTCIGNNIQKIPLVCPGDKMEYKPCVMTKLCTATVLTQWTSWSACVIPAYETLGSKTRRRECISYSYHTEPNLNCTLYNASMLECPDKAICPGIDFPSPYSAYCNRNCIQSSHPSTEKCVGTLTRDKSTDPKCSKPKVETEICTLPRAGCDATNCTFLWNPWGECSIQCGTGTRTRVGDCINQPNCNDTAVIKEICDADICPVDGNWGGWLPWSSCSLSCGGGVQTSKRLCNNPPPSHGGRPCYGTSEKTRQCNLEICAVNGKFGNWTEWSNCDRPCNNGSMTKTRKCDSPPPAYGGAQCVGDSEQKRLCNPHKCKEVSVTIGVKFVNETFTNELTNQDSAAFKAFEAKLLGNIRKLYDAEDNPVEKIRIWKITHHGHENEGSFELITPYSTTVTNKDPQFIWQNGILDNRRNGSVITNFTVYLRSAGSDEVIVLQNAIEDIRKITVMPLVRISFVSDDLPLPPLTFNASAIGPHEIKVHWLPVSKTYNNFTILGYIVFYKEVLATGSNWHAIAAVHGTNSLTIANLKAYTSYTLRVVTYHRLGNGMASPYLDERTLEGVPTKAPSPLRCTPESSSTVLLQWNRIGNNDWLGFMRGYAAYYKPYGSKEQWKRITFGATLQEGKLQGLKAFTRYEFQIAAYTGMGNGPMAWKECLTMEGVPSKAPASVKSQLDRSPTDIFVNWAKISPGDASGVLTGYRVYYGIARQGKKRIQYPVLRHIDVAADATSIKLTSFSINTEVVIYVSGKTSVGIGPKSIVRYQATCRCPEHIYTAWYSNKPYIYGSLNNVEGIFYNFLRKMVNSLCGTCKGSGIKKDIVTTLYFDRTKDGRKALRHDADSLLKRMDTNSHIHIPVFGRKEVDTIMKDFKFIPLVLNSGSAFVVRDPSRESKAIFIVNAVTSCWPALLVSMLMAALAGIVVWALERFDNVDEFSPGFVRGAATGLWWAFVSMTTMGYGDITPRSAPAKAVTIVWMLIGPLLNAVIIGVISTSLTSVTIEEKPKIYGNSEAVKHQLLLSGCEYTILTQQRVEDLLNNDGVNPLLSFVELRCRKTELTVFYRARERVALLSFDCEKILSVAVIHKSFEYSLAIRKNGKPNATGELYYTVDECINAVYEKKTFGTLLNSLSAISRSDELFAKGLKIVKVYTGNAGYGMALAGDVIGLEEDIRTYVGAHQNEITTAVEKYEKSLKIVPIKKNEEIDMFNHKSDEFKMFILCSLLTIGIFAILGAFMDYIIKPSLVKRKNTVNVLERSHYKEEALTKLVNRFHSSFLELSRKLEKRKNFELVRYLSKQGYVAGYHAYWKYGSMADDKVKREIFVSEIMLKNLKR